MSPRDRRRWRQLQNDRRELLAYKETLCQSLQRAYDMPLKLLEEIERVDKTIREDEEELASIAIKFARVDEEELAALTNKYAREDEEALAALGIKNGLNGGES